MIEDKNAKNCFELGGMLFNASLSNDKEKMLDSEKRAVIWHKIVILDKR